MIRDPEAVLAALHDVVRNGVPQSEGTFNLRDPYSKIAFTGENGGLVLIEQPDSLGVGPEDAFIVSDTPFEHQRFVSYVGEVPLVSDITSTPLVRVRLVREESYTRRLYLRRGSSVHFNGMMVPFEDVQPPTAFMSPVIREIFVL